ncbi:MAG: MBL fold metallo-hydrolase [Myxococcales bacterium]|nr:MBL fold metallo-hydrolase [Myxococcales bacterium]
MRRYDSSNPIAVTHDIHWVGFYENSSRLHCNPYLLIDEDEAVLIDPGSIPDFPVVMRKIIDVVNPGIISLIIASHQDPDVCGNLAVVEDVVENSALRIAAHTNTSRLIQHQNLRSEVYRVDEHQYAIELESGRKLDFLHLPFLHSPGAIATYDPKTKSLFTGDVFGAIPADWNLFAGGTFPADMKSFHQAYMPSNALLRRAMERIETMEVERILPQHGSVIEGEQIQVAIDFLKELPCGSDLFEA